MATDTEQLIVQLEARINDFEKSFQRANKTANDNWSKIESRGKQASGRIAGEFDKVTGGIANSFKSLGGSLAGSLGVGGALSAAGVLTMLVKINGELAKMGSLAKAAGLSTDRLQEVKFAANMGGVSDETFATDIQTSLHLLDEAQRQVNSLSRLFAANGKSIRDFNGDLLKFDGLLEQAAGLMSHAKNYQAKAAIAEMMGLSRDWIRVLEGGPAAFKKLADEARSSGYVVDAATIEKAKEFDIAWKQAITRFKAGMVSALSDLTPAFADFFKELINSVPGGEYLKHALRFWSMDLKGMALPELQKALEDAVEHGAPGAAERILAEIDRRLGKKPLKVTINADIKSDTKGPHTVIPADVQKNPFERAVFETNKRIAATNAETATIGLNTEARERAKLVAELEEAAKKANTEAGYQNAQVTEAQRQKINQLADAMEAAAKKQREAQEQFKAFNDVLQFSGGLAVDFIDRLGDSTQKLSDIITSALSALKRAALQAALLGQGPLAGIFGTQSTVQGGTGGIFGAIGSLLGGKREGGGPVDAGKAYVVGEKRPELFIPKMAGTILPAVPRIAGAAPTFVSAPNINVTVNGSAGTPAQNQDLAEKIARRMQEEAQALVTQGNQAANATWRANKKRVALTLSFIYASWTIWLEARVYDNCRGNMTDSPDDKTENTKDQSAPAGSPTTLAQFLESVGPSSMRDVPDLWYIDRSAGIHLRLYTPDIRIHCNNKDCGGVRTFRYREGNTNAARQCTARHLLDLSLLQLRCRAQTLFCFGR